MEDNSSSNTEGSWTTWSALLESVMANSSDSNTDINFTTTSSPLNTDEPLPSWDFNGTNTMPSPTGTMPTSTFPTESQAWGCGAMLFSQKYEYQYIFLSFAMITFGCFYLAMGYRSFRFVLSLSSFWSAFAIVYCICQVEDLLGHFGDLGAATLGGVLFSLICTLVPYVGFFTLGFQGGLVMGIVSTMFFPYGTSIWISVFVLLGLGLLGAVANVCSPKFTIFTTSLLGSLGLVLAMDYLIERYALAIWILGHLRSKERYEEQDQVCWLTLVIFAFWPIMTIYGILNQYFITAKDFYIHIYGYGYPDKLTTRNAPRAARLTREQRAEARAAKYRYLYQVRTAGGDILSQAYIQFLQNKPNADNTLSTHISTLPNNSSGSQDDLPQDIP